MPRATAFQGKPLVKWIYTADCSLMNAIGAISILASQASEPFATGQATSIEASQPAAGGNGAPAAPSPAFASDYAMSLLAKITHASADQALALIQGMLAPQA